MPSSDRSGNDDGRDSAPLPQQPNHNVPGLPIVFGLLFLLLVILGGIGVVFFTQVEADDSAAAAGSQEVEDFRIDLATAGKELADNPEDAKRKYFGRMIEFEVAEITVESLDRTHVVLLLPVEEKGVPASSFGLEFKGIFPFANPRNFFLKEARSGSLRVRVRGTVARIEHADAAPALYTFILDPAWVGRVE
jgi:hypothetical protein